MRRALRALFHVSMALDVISFIVDDLSSRACRYRTSEECSSRSHASRRSVHPGTTICDYRQTVVQATRPQVGIESAELQHDAFAPQSGPRCCSDLVTSSAGL